MQSEQKGITLEEIKKVGDVRVFSLTNSLATYLLYFSQVCDFSPIDKYQVVVRFPNETISREDIDAYVGLAKKIPLAVRSVMRRVFEGTQNYVDVWTQDPELVVSSIKEAPLVDFDDEETVPVNPLNTADQEVDPNTVLVQLLIIDELTRDGDFSKVESSYDGHVIYHRSVDLLKSSQAKA